MSRASSKSRRAYLYRDFWGRCFYCDTPVLLDPAARDRPDFATVDHVTPKVGHSRRVHNDPDNTVLACADCNNRKGGRPLILFLAELNRNRT